MDTLIPINQWNRMNEKNFPRLQDGPPPNLRINPKMYSHYLQKLQTHQMLQEAQDFLMQLEIGPFKPHMIYKIKLIFEELKMRISYDSPGLIRNFQNIFEKFLENYEHPSNLQ